MVCWSHPLIQTEVYLWLKACKINVCPYKEKTLLGGGLIYMKATWVHIKKRKGRTGLISQKTHLLLEISNCIFICIGEEVQDVMFYVVFLQVVHQVCSIALWASQYTDKYIKFWTKESPRFSLRNTGKFRHMYYQCNTNTLLEFLNFENELQSQKIRNCWIKIQSSLKNTSFWLLEKNIPKLQATHSHLEITGWILIEVSGVNIDHEFLLMFRVFENLRSKEQCKWEGLTFSRILTNSSVSYIQQISKPFKELYHHTQRIFKLVFSDLSQQSLRSPDVLSEPEGIRK